MSSKNTGGDLWSNTFLQIAAGLLFLGLAWWGFSIGLNDVYSGFFLIVGAILIIGTAWKSRGAKSSRKSKGSRRRR